jgi:hypothetical protein
MANKSLTAAKKAKNDEFYTQWVDIEHEMNAYLEYDPDVFRDKTVLLPCDDPEWSNFTKYFALHFDQLGLKKLISTSYAKPAEFPCVMLPPRGKVFTLRRDVTGDGRTDFDDIEWEYLEGDGDFRSDEVTALRDEADVVITNPPFSMFRDFMAWLVEGDVRFAVIGNLNAITYKEVFPLIKSNRVWLGNNYAVNGGAMFYEIPESIANLDQVREIRENDNGTKTYITRVQGVRWFTNIEHGRRHDPLVLMTEADNVKFGPKGIKGVGYLRYDNYDALEVPKVIAIPADYDGVVGVPISFLDKYCPEQFEILGNGQTMADELGIRPVGQKFVDDYYAQGNKGQINAKWNNLVYRIGTQTVVPYQRILIRRKDDQ